MKMSALKVGVDVPWVTSWTDEPVIGVRPCASVGGRPALIQVEAAGFGKPEYSKNHLLRQRLSIARMLCPMCGQPTQPEDRWTQVARRVPAGLLRKQGRGDGLSKDIGDADILLDAGAIAPLHKDCSDRSLRYCPHLKSDPNVNVMAFPERWAVTPLLIEATPPEMSANPLLRGPLLRGLAPTAPFAVITFLQLCGLTGRRDPQWKQNRLRYRPTPRPRPAATV